MIGKLAMAPLKGQSWRVLKSWYTGGGLASHADVFRGARFSSPPGVTNELSLKKPAWEPSGGLEQRIWALFRRRYLPGFDYVTSAAQARFSLQGHYSGQLFTPAELSPLRPKPENYSCP